MKRPNETDRLAALSRLMAAIHAHREAGESSPCIDPLPSHLWLSKDGEDREAAAHGCAICPALEACTAYVAAHPEPAGTWAGKHKSFPRIEVNK